MSDINSPHAAGVCWNVGAHCSHLHMHAMQKCTVSLHLGEELQVEREAALGEGAQTEAQCLADRVGCEVLAKHQRLHAEEHPEHVHQGATSAPLLAYSSPL